MQGSKAIQHNKKHSLAEFEEYNQNKPGHKPHLSEKDEKILLKYASFVECIVIVIGLLGSPKTVTWLWIMAERFAAKRLLS